MSAFGGKADMPIALAFQRMVVVIMGIPPDLLFLVLQLHFGDLARHHKFRFACGDDLLN